MWTTDGGLARGSVRAVSPELIGLANGEDGQTWVVQKRVAGVSPASDGFDAGVASDDRGPRSSATLTGLLASLAEERSVVTLRCGGRELSGRVAGAGSDVVSLRLPEGALAYLPVRELSLLRLT